MAVQRARTIAVALAQAGRRNEVREYGKIANTPTALKTQAAKLSRGGGRTAVLLLAALAPTNALACA
jgi:hypothetical protein